MKKRKKWSKENRLFFLTGCFFGIGIAFEGIGKFTILKIGHLFAVISFIFAFITLLYINKKIARYF